MGDVEKAKRIKLRGWVLIFTSTCLIAETFWHLNWFKLTTIGQLISIIFLTLTTCLLILLYLSYRVDDSYVVPALIGIEANLCVFLLI